MAFNEGNENIESQRRSEWKYGINWAVNVSQLMLMMHIVVLLYNECYRRKRKALRTELGEIEESG